MLSHHHWWTANPTLLLTDNIAVNVLCTLLDTFRYGGVLLVVRSAITSAQSSHNLAKWFTETKVIRSRLSLSESSRPPQLLPAPPVLSDPLQSLHPYRYHAYILRTPGRNSPSNRECSVLFLQSRLQRHIQSPPRDPALARFSCTTRLPQCERSAGYLRRESRMVLSHYSDPERTVYR